MVALAAQFDTDRFDHYADHYAEAADGSLVLDPRDRENLNARVAWLPGAERGRILEEGWFRGPKVYDEIEGAADETALRATDCLDGVSSTVSRVRSFIHRHARGASIVGGLATGVAAASSAMQLWQR